MSMLGSHFKLTKQLFIFLKGILSFDKNSGRKIRRVSQISESAKCMMQLSE
jgi:hypothetical protein